MVVRALQLQLTGEQTLVAALNGLLTSKWTSQVVNGQTILTSAEAGGSVTFTFERAYTPAELAVMVQETLEGVTEGAEVEVLREALAAMASALDGSGSLSEQGATEVVDESIDVLYRECGPYWDIG